MQSLVPGRDFRSSLNSRSHKKKVCGCFCNSQWQSFGVFCVFCLEKNCLCYPRSGDEGSNTSLNNRINNRIASLLNQGKQFSQYSDINNSRLVSSSASFPRNMILKYKMKLSEGSWDKILHSKLRTQCLWKEEKKFLAVFFFEAIYQSSGSSFHVFFVKTTKESYQPFWNHSIAIHTLACGRMSS